MHWQCLRCGKRWEHPRGRKLLRVTRDELTAWPTYLEVHTSSLPLCNMCARTIVECLERGTGLTPICVRTPVCQNCGHTEEDHDLVRWARELRTSLACETFYGDDDPLG